MSTKKEQSMTKILSHDCSLRLLGDVYYPTIAED